MEDLMSIAKGVLTHHYFTGVQGDFETPKGPASDHEVKLKSALTFVKTQNAEPRDDYHPNTRDLLEETPLGIDCTLSATAYVLGGGAQGLGPDVSSALETAFAMSFNNATSVAAVTDENNFTLTDTNELGLHDIGKIDISDGAGNVVGQRYFVVIAKSSQDDELTVFPSLPIVPVVGDVIKSVVNYNLMVSNPNAITCHRSDNVVGEMGVGCKFHGFNWRFAQGQTGELSLEGQCRDVVRSVHTTITTSGGIDDTQTDFTVADRGIEAGAVINCQSELMYVTRASGSELIVTRGFQSTVPAVYAQDTAIGPYEPDGSTHGSPIRGIFGGVWIGVSALNYIELKAEEVTVHIDEKTQYVHWFGGEGKAKLADNPENREVSWSIVCYLDADTAEMVKYMTANTAMKVFFQAGQADGAGCAFYSPYVQFNVPEIPDAKGELVKVTLSSRAVMADPFFADKENSIQFGY
jgi:hypothetical protein